MEYFHTDLLGSVRLVTDETGNAVATTTFDEYGTPASHTGTQPAIGFTGAWTDAATGLVHLRARDYDPATGQFLTVDPLVDETRQPYAYVGNNPLQLTDPSGLAALSDGEVYDRPYILLDMMLNFGTGGAYGVQQSLCAGNDLWSSLNMAYNPVYSVIEGYSNGVRDIRNGESGFRILMDGLQLAGGIAGVAGIGLGVGFAGALARAGTAAPVRTFASVDPYVADAANAVEAAFPGRVLGVNKMAMMTNGLQREIDIDLGNIFVQVKGGPGTGLTGQIEKTRMTTGTTTVGYAPRIGDAAWRNAALRGVPIMRTLDELLAYVGEFG